MIATFQNSAFVLSIGDLLLADRGRPVQHLPGAMYSGLTAQGVPAAAAHTSPNCPR